MQALERALARATLPLPPARADEPSRISADDIRIALQDVIDPEVGVNVVDLGLVREVAANGQGVEVRMVVCPDCSLVGYLIEQVRRRVRSVVGDSPVEVTLLDETWSWSDAAPHLIWGDGI